MDYRTCFADFTEMGFATLADCQRVAQAARDDVTARLMQLNTDEEQPEPAPPAPKAHNRLRIHEWYKHYGGLDSQTSCSRRRVSFSAKRTRVHLVRGGKMKSTALARTLSPQLRR